MTLPDLSSPEPLVSIGVPTFNGAATLERAVRSALDQDYSNLEVVISDNCSTDATPELCRQLASSPQVRYFRNSRNRGAPANYRAVLERARGEFFMWLADDDWLTPSYVSECLAVFLPEPGYSLVSGAVRYHPEAGEGAEDGIAVDLRQSSGEARVLEYYRQVADNGTFYGMARRRDLLEIPFPHVLAGDWHFVAALAFRGKVATVPSVRVHRRLPRVTDGLHTTLRRVGLPSWQGRYPEAVIAAGAFRWIAWTCSAFSELPLRSRLRLALQARRIVLDRRGMFGRSGAALVIKRRAAQAVLVLRSRLPHSLYQGLRVLYRVIRSGGGRG